MHSIWGPTGSVLGRRASATRGGDRSYPAHGVAGCQRVGEEQVPGGRQDPVAPAAAAQPQLLGGRAQAVKRGFDPHHQVWRRAGDGHVGQGRGVRPHLPWGDGSRSPRGRSRLGPLGSWPPGSGPLGPGPGRCRRVARCLGLFGFRGGLFPSMRVRGPQEEASRQNTPGKAEIERCFHGSRRSDGVCPVSLCAEEALGHGCT